MTKRIAVWSGPRNLSTAMMYSFAGRGDCAVVDEPFYAAYLARSGVWHPMRDEVLASQPTDPDVVVRNLLAPKSEPLFYQKHMSHHMIDGMSRDWIGKVQNVYLIRDPVRVVASYAAKREMPDLDDLGFAQQYALFEANPGVVIDATDIRADPESMLQKLCEALGIRWMPSMLHWPAGGHAADGVWSRHWYGAVHRSTGFASPETTLPDLDAEHAKLAQAAMPYFEALASHKIT
ncbi:MAG: HAD family hydrolase [Paracoccaceae bacterium]